MEKYTNDLSKAFYKSPIGYLEIAGTENGIYSVSFRNEAEEIKDIPKFLQNCVKQLDEYFNGKRKEFDIKLDIQGTSFQKQVWNELIKIPFGKTSTYLEIAKKIKNPKAVRAVGNANRNNKIGIVIPCHRVIGTNGKLTGFAAGIWRKEWLIKHENK
ncbi:MAG: methylated-DNA--[protein]-cysteine S-methyltransferase [Bacteroidales bacterium]|nr:methylated-DNA--[protein]-cysteine S-methyltransferase [Bacteroidales bacterium]